MTAALTIGMRWIHLVSVIVLLGGVFYARVAVGEMAAGFKPVAFGAIAGIIVSGVYNFLSKTSASINYQVWFAIKMLLALHVFAAVILYQEGKKRALTGIAITGAVIVAISGYLRWISLK
jgi:hypothetical protein